MYAQPNSDKKKTWSVTGLVDHLLVVLVLFIHWIFRLSEAADIKTSIINIKTWVSSCLPAMQILFRFWKIEGISMLFLEWSFFLLTSRPYIIVWSEQQESLCLSVLGIWMAASCCSA